MANLKYKTKGNSPKGKPKVYFCCHEDDFEKYFESISNEVLSICDCAVWYADGSIVRDEDFLNDLAQMQLFVIPVTTGLLCTESAALKVDFKVATDVHIPVLPIMQEKGLEKLFSEKLGNLQFLERNQEDSTAISYEDKLKKYLESVLIGNDLVEKIRSSFDAYVFLSYRKKDRKYAQELMRLIHKNEFCRDIAIWYDEFLTPGEDFNDSIRDALKKSELFVMTVTPNLVNETNYIMTTEYPMAMQEDKLILPAELIPTDRKELLEKYTDIPTPTDARNEAELSGALFNAVKKMAIKENDASPEHNFFIGLAYLGGVDVEINYTRAIDLITSAAEAGFVDAMEKLIDIYQNGIGVSSDYTKVVFWQRKLNDSLKSQLDIKKTTDAEIKRYSDLVFLLSNNLKRMGFGDESVAVRKEYCEFYEAFVSMRYKDDSRKLPEAYQELFYDYSKIGLKDKARICIEKAFSHFTGDAWECDVKNVWLFTDVSRNLLKINEEAERGKILETIDKIVELFIQRSEALSEADRFAALIDLYESYANILKSENKCAAAEKYYIDSYSLIAEKVDFDKVVDTRIINKLLGVLHSLNLLKRYEGKEEESKKYALKTVDLCLKYIDWIERFEYDKSRKILMISDQYNGISNQYKNSGIYFDALCYGEKRCKYLENAAENGLTVKFAKLLESAYYDLIAIYKAKECTQELSGEEKENKAAVIKKRIETLGFIFERYNEEPDSLYALRRACDTLHALISSHMSIGDKKEATDYTEKKLKLSLDIYAKTRFLSDAYSAYYDASYFYERLEQYDKAVEYLVSGIEYEEKEIQGLSSRDEQERLAYLYRKAGNAYIKAGSSEKGVVLFKKSFQIKADIHNKYNDLDSAKALYRSISEMALYTHSFDDSIILAEKLQALKAEWPQL